MAITENIVIDQGVDYLKSFIAKNDAGAVIDLNDPASTLTAQVRKSFASTTATDFAATVTAGSTGAYTLALTIAKTTALERGRHVYDVVQTITATGFKTRIHQGVATVNPSVTRPAS